MNGAVPLQFLDAVARMLPDRSLRIMEELHGTVWAGCAITNRKNRRSLLLTVLIPPGSTGTSIHFNIEDYDTEHHYRYTTAEFDALGTYRRFEKIEFVTGAIPAEGSTWNGELDELSPILERLFTFVNSNFIVSVQLNTGEVNEEMADSVLSMFEPVANRVGELTINRRYAREEHLKQDVLLDMCAKGTHLQKLHLSAHDAVFASNYLDEFMFSRSSFEFWTDSLRNHALTMRLLERIFFCSQSNKTNVHCSFDGPCYISPKVLCSYRTDMQVKQGKSGIAWFLGNGKYLVLLHKTAENQILLELRKSFDPDCLEPREEL